MRGAGMIIIIIIGMSASVSSSSTECIFPFKNTRITLTVRVCKRCEHRSLELPVDTGCTAVCNQWQAPAHSHICTAVACLCIRARAGARYKICNESIHTCDIHWVLPPDFIESNKITNEWAEQLHALFIVYYFVELCRFTLNRNPPYTHSLYLVQFARISKIYSAVPFYFTSFLH